MDEGDIRIRNHVYLRFVELGRAPTFAELRDELGDVQTALHRLHDDHAIVLEPDGTEIRMANPFSAVPTPYRVEAGGRSWYGNCAWDAFGIPAALQVDGHVSSTCPDWAIQSRSTSATNAPCPTGTSSTSPFRRRTGGTTSSSPEAR